MSDLEHWILMAQTEADCAGEYMPRDLVHDDDFVQRGARLAKEAIAEILALKEQVASLQRVLAHRRDSDSEVAL